ncbi:MAG: type IV pilus biogenesis/stability protein PilW [Steroidobacteraceae bacterium]
MIRLLFGLTPLLLCACVSTSNGSGGARNDKDAAQANMQLGVAYMQQNNLPVAKEKLERAAKQAPRNADVHSALAYLYERLNQPKQAENEYRTALRLAPDNSEVSNNFAVFLCRNGHTEEALKRFEAASQDRLYRTPWAALTNAGVCLRGVKRFDEARASFERALRMRPNHAEAAYQLADLQLNQQQPDAASKTIDNFLTMAASPDLLLLGVRVANARGDRVQRESYARRLRRDYPNSAQVRALPELMQ